MDNCVVNVDEGHNEGLTSRAQFTKESKRVDLMGRLHCDLFFQEKLLLNGVSMRIKLTRSKDSFAVMAAADRDNEFKIKIVDAVLRVRKVCVSPVVALAHVKALEHGNVKYAMNRVECKSFTVPAQHLSITQEQIFSGQLPSRIVIGYVDNDAFNGNYKKNPFNFQHYNITEISLYVDGQERT
jgi:hypothetical protein